MKNFNLYLGALILCTFISCDDHANRDTEKITQKVMGNWEITQIIYYRSPAKADSILNNLGTIEFTGTCKNSGCYQRYAYYKIKNKPEIYTMAWDVIGNSGIFNFFSQPWISEEPLDLEGGGSYKITEITSFSFVIELPDKKIVFSRIE